MQVTVKELYHSFDGTNDLFSGLNFDLHDGELVALTGPSGSGKSTLLSMLSKWEKPNKGIVEWNQIDTVGWVFQNPHGVANRTVIDHVCLPFLAKHYSRETATKKALTTLSRFGLQKLAHQKFSTLSGGEAQRLMLARAVAKGPSLLLVDEPTAQLDPVSAATVNGVLGELAMAKSIVVVATHDTDTKNACHRVIDLRESIMNQTGYPA